MSHPENELKELQKLEKRINSCRPSNERLQLGGRLFQQEEPGPQPIYLRWKTAHHNGLLSQIGHLQPWVQVLQLCMTFSLLTPFSLLISNTAIHLTSAIFNRIHHPFAPKSTPHPSSKSVEQSSSRGATYYMITPLEHPLQLQRQSSTFLLSITPSLAPTVPNSIPNLEHDNPLCLTPTSLLQSWCPTPFHH